MSIANSAYFSFASLLATSGQPVSPAELHGLLLGRSCAGAGFSPDTWLADAADLLGESLPENLRQGLIGLQEMVRSDVGVFQQEKFLKEGGFNVKSRFE